jgi:hypothetical protein
MKSTYVLIGSMTAHEGIGRLVEKFMARQPEVAFNQEEMEEITRWYGDDVLKWVRTYNNGETGWYEEVYSWITKNGEVRHSKNPKYVFKKIMEEKYGNLGYDD